MERKYQEEIEKLKERLFSFTVIGSTLGYAFGCILGHLDAKQQMRKENTAFIQKITSQENTTVKQDKTEHTR